MSLLSIGVTGLNVSQTYLTITGNNIANANNPAYTRQRAELATIPEQYVGVGYIGNGAGVESITRVADEFLVKQIALDTSAFNSLDVFATNMNQIDRLLADGLSGLSPGIDGFFSAIETGAQDPTSIPARQLVLSNAEGLVERFNTLYQRVAQQNLAVNDQLSSLTAQVTALAEAIANLNADIEEQVARGNGAVPNNSLDDRDELIRRLSELVSVQVVEQDSGSVNVFIGRGQNLVVGNTSNALGIEASTRNPGTFEITFTGPGGVPQQVTDFLSGGKVGGLLEFRSDIIDQSFNALGRLAIGMTATINEQNQRGVDLEGNLGGLIFQDISNTPQVIGDRNNDTVTPTVATAVISDIDQLTTSDYVVLFDTATDYTILRTEDNVSVTGTVGAFPATVSIDGVDITFSGGAADAGDIFYVRPTRNGANNIDMQISRPQELAFASAILTNADIGNVGTGEISPGEVINVLDSTGAPLSEFATAGQLSPPVLIRFTSTTAYDILDSSTGAAISTGNSFVPGIVNTVSFGTPAAYQVEINGSPAAGDEFTIDYNATGIGDNRNAVEIGALRISNELDSGSLSFEDAYGRLVESIGARTAQVRISRDASESLLIQTQANRDALSGVSLEEEAANLIQFEQSYSANAQVINVARQLFDTLLAIF